MKRKLDAMRAVAVVTYKEWSAYRTHSMVSIFVGPVYFAVQYFIWTALYRSSPPSHMSLEQMLAYYGAVALIGYLTMDFADWNLQMLVRTGKFLTFNLRPMHHRLYALSQKIGHRVLGFVFEFIPCFLIFRFVFGIDMIPARPFWTVVSVILAFLMNFYVNYTIGLTAFWLVQASGIRQVFQALSGLLSGAVIPLTLFPEPLQKLLFVLPFQYVGYVPAMVFTGSYQLAGISLPIPAIVGLQACAVVLTAVLSEIVYRLSMRRFAAVGG